MKRRRAFTNEQLETLPEFDYTPEEAQRIKELKEAWGTLRKPKEETDEETDTYPADDELDRR
jgi:hypothetical protein